MVKIVIDKLTKRFGDVEVLPPIDLSLDDGEFTVLVGPSGCGKSTTLRILAGLEGMTSGEIYFDGRPVSRLEPKDRDIAMVFQDYALYPHMTIAGNMSFALRLAKVARGEIDERVKRVATTLNIAHLLGRKPAELSGGQRQRVAMGRALVRDASTFLFDEPLSNLDAKLRGHMRAELAEMRDRLDKNMIYVTHDQVEAMTLGDRIVVMSEGRIQQQGTAEELFKRPVNAFVAGFIGTPTMNFVSARIEREGDLTVLRGAGFEVPVGEETARRLDAVRQADVTVGIRPSSFASNARRGAPIQLKVVVSEYLGAQTTLITKLPSGEEIVVELSSATPVRPGSVTTFGVVTEEVLIFDRTTGARL